MPFVTRKDALRAIAARGGQDQSPPHSEEGTVGTHPIQASYVGIPTFFKAPVIAPADIKEGMTVVADTQLLRVVLDNLLRNAWKFTAKHPTARIELGQHRDNGHRVFFVTDDGAGFDMAHANLLFAPFQRLHRQSDFEGTGVGLATVQRIIHRHGGQLWADGAVERGASFSFTLSEVKS